MADGNPWRVEAQAGQAVAAAMPEVLIVADDLSGAADCAAGCAVAGLETCVLLEPAPDVAASAAAVAVDVKSRGLSPQDAARAMADAVRRMRGPGTRVVYHKIDSTLRGNWASELAHAKRALAGLAREPTLAVVAPAFPALGRTTRAGRVLVHGAPLGETAMWKTAGKSGAGDLQAMLRQAGLNVRTLELDDVRRGPAHMARLLRDILASAADAAVCDAETDQDLALIAEALLSVGSPALWAGSAGLMRQAARLLAPGTRSAAAPAPARGPLLFVVGSASEVSHAQFAALAAQPGITAITVAPEALQSATASASLLDLGARLDSALGLGTDVAVAIDPAGTPGVDAAGLVSALVAILGPRLAGIGGLVATGGETARGILEAAGIAGIRLGGEVEPGVPWGVTVGDAALPVVTKAGAFGDDRTLLRCRDALKGMAA